MRLNTLETIVGAVVLVVAGLFFYYAYSASMGGHRPGYSLYAQFDRVDGLVRGNDVKLSGVVVGSVEGIQVDPTSFLARVSLAIDPAVQVPADSSAEILSESFMGGKYIAIVPGGSDTFLPSGGTFQYTQSAISWESLIGKFLFSKKDDDSPAPEK